MEVVSLTISHLTSTLFSLTFYELIGVASISESTCHLWKVFKWWFLSWQRLNFRWLFVSQQRLLALTTPRVTFIINFVNNFRDGSGSVFSDFFFVNKGWAHWRIHASPLEVVSLTISHSAPTPFLLTFFKLTGAASISEFTRHLWKFFRWWFLSQQRTSFRWLLTRPKDWCLVPSAGVSK